jgi:hypothetical protein
VVTYRLIILYSSSSTVSWVMTPCSPLPRRVISQKVVLFIISAARTSNPLHSVPYPEIVVSGHTAEVGWAKQRQGRFPVKCGSMNFLCFIYCLLDGSCFLSTTGYFMKKRHIGNMRQFSWIENKRLLERRRDWRIMVRGILREHWKGCVASDPSAVGEIHS